MNTPRDQLYRLLRGAAEARRKAAAEPIEAPSAAWLLARAERQGSMPPEVFLMFRRALVASCILLIAIGVVAAREIREHQATALNLGEAAQLQITDAFAP